jgi:hypothetical protein
MIKFTASLPVSKNAVAFDGEGQSKISLIAPASELPEVIKLALLGGRAFRVICIEIDPKTGKEKG